MGATTWRRRVRSWIAGKLFALAGLLDESYDVWLDDAPRKERDRRCSADSCAHGNFACPNGCPDEVVLDG